MDIAKKLREVVTSNFIEIVRTDEDERQKQTASTFGANAPVAPLEPRTLDFKARRDDVETRARRELDEDTADEASLARPVAEEPVTPLREVPEVWAEANLVEEGESIHDTVREAIPYSAASLDSILREATPNQKVTQDDIIVVSVPELQVGEPATEALPLSEIAEAEAANEMQAVEPIISGEMSQQVEAIQPPAEEKIETEAETLSGPDPLAYVNQDGNIDFSRLIKDANLPAVAFTAEQARKLIVALPEELPMRVKRMTVKATLDAVNPNAEIDPKDIVADAMLKQVQIGQFRDNLSSHIEQGWRNHLDEIAHLREQVARLEEVVERERDRQRQVEVACDQQIGHYQQVIMFFQTDEAVMQSAETTTSEDEVPAFMRDDSVHRLLGMNGREEPGENGDVSGDTRRRSRR